jgi:hypothetical protein
MVLSALVGGSETPAGNAPPAGHAAAAYSVDGSLSSGTVAARASMLAASVSSGATETTPLTLAKNTSIMGGFCSGEGDEVMVMLPPPQPASRVAAIKLSFFMVLSCSCE